MERPAWAPQGIDINVPSVSRMYDFFLGGSHNFEVDREAARKALAAWPGMPTIVKENRAFMRRAVRFAIGEGVTQFLDIGSGIPTFGNVHEVAHDADPAARVVYVDNDPVAVAHSEAVLRDVGTAGIVPADFRAPQDILGHSVTKDLLDFDRPVALLLVALLHFVQDQDDPWGCVAELRDALPPGSLLIVTHGVIEEGTPAWGRDGDEVTKVYQRTKSPAVSRTQSEVERFFDGWDLFEPGLVALPHWRPEAPIEEWDPGLLNVCAGVGRLADRTGRAG